MEKLLTLPARKVKYLFEGKVIDAFCLTNANNSVDERVMLYVPYSDNEEYNTDFFVIAKYNVINDMYEDFKSTFQFVNVN